MFNYKINLKKVGYCLLFLMILLRPMITVMVGKTAIPFHSIIPTIFSYLLIFTLFLTIKNIKVNVVSSIIVFFCGYLLVSTLWGSNIKEVLEFMLPFTYYFACREFLPERKMGKVLIIAAIVGYLIPIIGSLAYNISGLSKSYIQYGMGMEKKYGMYSGIHTAAHSFVYFSFFYAIYRSFKEEINKNICRIVDILFGISVLLVWNTYVRSAYLGFIVFWYNYLFFLNRKLFLCLFIFTIGVGFYKLNIIESIFWQADARGRQKDLATASSGRTEIWQHQIKMFTEGPYYRKLLGHGLGIESGLKRAVGNENQVWSSHNDYLTILMSLGVAGLFLYLSIIVSLIFEIYSKVKTKKIKIILLSVILSFSLTAFVTNGGIFRFENNQMFWFLMGMSSLYFKNGLYQNK